jgi:simple sugar transport system ATP-binding protein
MGNREEKTIMKAPLVEMRNITKTFGGVHALNDVSLSIQPGEVHCLAGENGCGKSTLIKVLSGVHIPDSGEIYINGKRIKSLSPIDAINEGIQVIYQDFSIFPNLTVTENIALSNEIIEKKKIVSWSKMRSLAKEALEKINVKINLNTLVEDLSIADKQLVAISRAIMQKAKLIIMDEPTTALTHKEVDSLFKVISNLKREGISILFVSHKLEEVFEISERISIMRNGRNIITEEIPKLDTEKLVYYMTGRKIKETYYEVKTNNDTPLLRVESLGVKGFFEDVSFQINKGEIIGLTGLLGSGRTELAEALFGLLPVNKGKLFIEGKEKRIHSVQDAIKERIAYIPEDRLTEGLFLEQSIERNIVISIIDQLRNKFKMIHTKSLNQSVEHWIKNLGIVAHNASLPVKTLSGGNQQKVVLSKWLLANPKILILNGPTVGVDIGAKEEIHKVIRSLADEGMGVLLISDDLPELRQNCNRVLVMNQGKISGETLGKDINQMEWKRLQEAH